MEFEPLYLEIEHKISKLEKMAQRFMGATESVDEFRRRIEKESKEQHSINKQLFQLKKKHDAEQDALRRGLSPQQEAERQKAEQLAANNRRELMHKTREEAQQFHDEHMRFLNDNYATEQQSLRFKQQQILSKKRDSRELDEVH